MFDAWEAWTVAGVLVVSMGLFVWGRWRYDLVALMALLTLSMAGIVPASEAFSGLGHPAVVTVAAILILSAGLAASGAIDQVAARLDALKSRPTLQLIALMLLVAVASGFVNNVGALAMVIPVAIQLARTAGRSPSTLLMPLAFASLLGGMTTLIGTPSNLIVASFRAEYADSTFGLFDFTPVGVGVAVAGLLFTALFARLLIPHRDGQHDGDDLFEIDQYLFELRVPEKSKAAGMSVAEIGGSIEEEISIIGVARGERRIVMPSIRDTIAVGDILLVESDAAAAKSLAQKLQLELMGDKELREALMRSDEIEVMEAIVTPGAYMERRSVEQLNLRRRFGVNLLGVSRQGRRIKRRIRAIAFEAGDILLLQGNRQTLQDALQHLGCLPLARRNLALIRPRKGALATGLFAASVAVIALGWMPAHLAFVAGAMAMVLTRLLTLREAYQAVDWPVIVLLAAMLPVGGALETSGGAKAIADGLLMLGGSWPPAVLMGLLFVVVTLLSAIVNNAAAVVLTAPIAITLAQGVQVSPDGFLMAVAVGASCAFLTPIAHQSNTLVMGPGGYRFGDYARLGLPLSIVVGLTAIPLILWFWPLRP